MSSSLETGRMGGGSWTLHRSWRKVTLASTGREENVTLSWKRCNCSSLKVGIVNISVWMIPLTCPLFPVSTMSSFRNPSASWNSRQSVSSLHANHSHSGDKSITHKRHVNDKRISDVYLIRSIKRRSAPPPPSILLFKHIIWVLTSSTYAIL